jgi:hypothetical protein
VAEIRLALAYTAVVLAIAWSIAACKSDAPVTGPARPTDHVAYIIHAPAGTPIYTGPSTSSTRCPATNGRLDGLLAGQAPGGWVAVGTDDYARASDGVSPCLRQPRVWLHIG